MAGTAMKIKPSDKKKKIINQEMGKVFINATFNNTLVTVTDMNGASLAWGSAGRSGFKGTRKSTPYAATTAVESVLKRVKDEFGMKTVNVYIKGPGPGRDAALRVIRSVGLKMELIADVTPMPFNGPRAKKKRHG